MNSALLSSFKDEFLKIAVSLSAPQMLGQAAKAARRGWSAEREGLSLSRIMHSDAGPSRQAFTSKMREARRAPPVQDSQSTKVGRRPKAPGNMSGLEDTHVAPAPAPMGKPKPTLKMPSAGSMKGFAAGAGLATGAGMMLSHPAQQQAPA